MLACVDVDYRDDAAIAGCLLFRDWAEACAAEEVIAAQEAAAPYRSGEFYLRELPPILLVLSRVKARIQTVVVDGYVWLSGSQMGLGAHLYSALQGEVPIIGVAKNVWRGATHAQDAVQPERRTIAVTRGRSKRPLYVTAAGIDVALAANLVGAMHGPFRIPTLLAAVNRLVRSTSSTA